MSRSALLEAIHEIVIDTANTIRADLFVFAAGREFNQVVRVDGHKRGAGCRRDE
jgi:hypothetical protein